MNQILSTKLKSNSKIREKKNWFRFQFTFSIIIIVFLIGFGLFYFYHLERKEDFSNSLIANYHIYKLYRTNNQHVDGNSPKITTSSNSNELFGIIEIPKINLYYPIFSHLTEDLLKISPCKFYGDIPAVNGNICIAGHNYDNALFFSKLPYLSSNDKIHIFDNNGNLYIYLITSIYEVEQSDLSPVLNYPPDKKTLTLVTCNNFNANRIIVKAIQTEQKQQD